MKTTPVYQHPETPSETDMQEPVYQWGPEGCQLAEAVSDWNVFSNQQSFIDQAIDQLQDCFNACLEDKSKHCEFAIRFLRNSRLLKRTVLLLWTNWLMFHEVGWEQPSG